MIILLAFIGMTQRAGREMHALSQRMQAKYVSDDLGKPEGQGEVIPITGPGGQA